MSLRVGVHRRDRTLSQSGRRSHAADARGGGRRATRSDDRHAHRGRRDAERAARVDARHPLRGAVFAHTHRRADRCASLSGAICRHRRRARDPRRRRAGRNCRRARRPRRQRCAHGPDRYRVLRFHTAEPRASGRRELARAAGHRRNSDARGLGASGARADDDARRIDTGMDAHRRGRSQHLSLHVHD